jgi:hypothetical protein
VLETRGKLIAPRAPCAQVSLGRDRVLVEYDIGNSFAATGVVARAAVAHPSICFALEFMTYQPVVLVTAGDAREGAKHLYSAALTEWSFIVRRLLSSRQPSRRRYWCSLQGRSPARTQIDRSSSRVTMATNSRF